MSGFEILGFVTGAVSVALAVCESPWNWPVGIVNNLFFLALFWKTKLYADAILQVVYIVLSIFGWWNWLWGGAGHSELSLSRVSKSAGVQLTTAAVGSAVLLSFLLHGFTDSNVPFWDGITTALSLTAQYMLSKKVIENWWVWIMADAIYIALYCYKGLYLTGILYLGFLVMCVAGYHRWDTSTIENANRSSEVPAT
jgi:nicotinamide mononucleotide transporter